jgi:hypothetical protein
MPNRESDGYADYVEACKMVKAERIIPARVVKTLKAMHLLEKTVANVKLVKILEGQGNNIKDALNEYNDRVALAVDSNVSNKSKESSTITFNL